MTKSKNTQSKQARQDPPPVPGAPASEAPELAEPTKPREPLPPKPDQAAPADGGPTGVPGCRDQQGAHLTTAQGVRLGDTDHSLKAGPRGPVLLQDHHLREKIMHFDHERIPERAVHARGAAAHGTFVANGAASKLTRAAFLAKGVETPVFVRFSTVAGSRGSADTVRDTRGFATKFYTSEGVYDLVGNNIPVFFIQDAIKFPDVVHSVKPQPDREIPQAQSAHDTFWDFVSLHTEAQAHTMWNMSDRGIPRSYRMMEGFGVHTFTLVNEAGETSLVKFHWKPRLGVHSVTWEEALLLNGADPDYHRRDLADAIEAGAFPEWDLGIQVFPDTEDQMFEGIDLLDPTKFIPEELAPVQVIGTMTLNANPTNYFAETEQVAFHPGHLVPGIDVSNDALLQGRLFSYLDTQLTRLGGPNFSQIPINRPHAPVNDMLRDGFHQDAVPGGVAPYRPNSLDGGCPFVAGADQGAFIDVPQPVQGRKVREQSASFDDHFSQVGLFFSSLTEVEQEHVIGAYTFELSKCYEENIRVRQLQCLANIDQRLCAEVAAGLGLPAPEPTEKPVFGDPSPAVSQLGKEHPVDGRMVGILVDADTTAAEVQPVVEALLGAGTQPLLIGPNGAKVGGELAVQRTFATATAVELDALLLVGSGAPADEVGRARDARVVAGPLDGLDPRAVMMVRQAYQHAKPIAVVGEPGAIFTAAGVPAQAAGVVSGSAAEIGDELLKLLAKHRVWERFQG
ncbi:catalase [Enemella dayhoffiae]|uniref:catalase n=1 Tax=Enemella dayhoffiae TaxID=2016507 RepID=UPI001E2D4D7C|nr:catalase [Enemella dayhoffiae]